MTKNTTKKAIPTIILQNEHKISKKQLNKNVIDILEKLKKTGFSAYIVGGGVRDLILGYKPKDFDIVTDARPEQIRSLFINSRIIGHRFRLLQIYFGHEIIEVATFRASPKETYLNNVSKSKSKSNNLGKPDHKADHLLIIRDNTYGTIDDDIWRRDFTINALYYDAIKEEILDYCDGYDDLKNHCIKILGDPKTRYKEDPIRMLRAIRFAAKLDFSIEEKSLAPIKDPDFHGLLDDISRSRLYEEYNKFCLTGHSEKSFYTLNQYKLFNKLFPYTATDNLKQKFPQHLSFLHAVLKSTDNNLPINPAFLLAAFLWHSVQLQYEKLNSKNPNSKHDREYLWREAAHTLIKKQNQSLSIPKSFTKVIEDIWYLQRLFNNSHPKAIHKAAKHPKFRAGFDFLVLRSEVEPVDENKLKWWQVYKAANDEARENILKNYEQH